VVRGRLLTALGLAVLGFGLSGCRGPGDVNEGKLEGQIKAQVERKGGSVSSVSCPSGEKLEKGRAFTCTLRTARGEAVPIKVKITSTKDGGRAEYAIPPDILRD
jgi:Domain of unknown function (DUF4333)